MKMSINNLKKADCNISIKTFLSTFDYSVNLFVSSIMESYLEKQYISWLERVPNKIIIVNTNANCNDSQNTGTNMLNLHILNLK